MRTTTSRPDRNTSKFCFEPPADIGEYYSGLECSPFTSLSTSNSWKLDFAWTELAKCNNIMQSNAGTRTLSTWNVVDVQYSNNRRRSYVHSSKTLSAQLFGLTSCLSETNLMYSAERAGRGDPARRRCPKVRHVSFPWRYVIRCGKLTTGCDLIELQLEREVAQLSSHKWKTIHGTLCGSDHVQAAWKELTNKSASTKDLSRYGSKLQCCRPLALMRYHQNDHILFLAYSPDFIFSNSIVKNISSQGQKSKRSKK